MMLVFRMGDTGIDSVSPVWLEGGEKQHDSDSVTDYTEAISVSV